MIHPFRFKDKYIVLDVESGAVHSLDKTAYDVVCAHNSGSDPYVLGFDASDVDEILSELAELKRNGSFDAPEPKLYKQKPIFKFRILKADCLADDIHRLFTQVSFP